MNQCGYCEAEIDGGDFCSESHQRLWHCKRLGLGLEMPEEELLRVMRAFAESWCEATEALRPVFEALDRFMRRMGSAPVARAPLDAKERALWLRQHRNTGPSLPRRMDGRR